MGCKELGDHSPHGIKSEASTHPAAEQDVAFIDSLSEVDEQGHAIRVTHHHAAGQGEETTQVHALGAGADGVQYLGLVGQAVQQGRRITKIGHRWHPRRLVRQPRQCRGSYPHRHHHRRHRSRRRCRQPRRSWRP